MKKLFALLFTFAPLLAMAQTNGGAPADVPPFPGGWVNMLIVALTPIAIAAIKWAVPKIPSVALPFVAPALGVVLDQLAAFASGHPSNVLTGAVFGGLGLWLREAVDQSKKTLAGTPAKIVPLLLLCPLLAGGCKNTLEQGGAYAPGSFAVSTNTSGVVVTNFIPSIAADRAFFEAELAYDLAYSIIDAAFEFERANRAKLFAISPMIKHNLDKAREAAWPIHVQWARARQAYLANPTPAGLNQIQTLLSQLRQVAAAVEAATK